MLRSYRYTPLLAALLMPNALLGDLWGKALFAACDCAVGYMLLCMLQHNSLALAFAGTWLLNPIVINVSTRGNAEGFVAIWAVASLYAFQTRRYTAAAALLGVATHVKLYPVVYGVPMALFILRRGASTLQDCRAIPAPFSQRLRSALAFGAGSTSFMLSTPSPCMLALYVGAKYH